MVNLSLDDLQQTSPASRTTETIRAHRLNHLIEEDDEKIISTEKVAITSKEEEEAATTPYQYVKCMAKLDTLVLITTIDMTTTTWDTLEDSV